MVAQCCRYHYIILTACNRQAYMSFNLLILFAAVDDLMTSTSGKNDTIYVTLGIVRTTVPKANAPENIILRLTGSGIVSYVEYLQKLVFL